MLEISKFDAHVTSMDASMCPVCECLDGLRECVTKWRGPTVS
jgi:hypothetical protein